jgi:hypothetical protein
VQRVSRMATKFPRSEPHRISVGSNKMTITMGSNLDWQKSNSDHSNRLVRIFARIHWQSCRIFCQPRENGRGGRRANDSAFHFGRKNDCTTRLLRCGENLSQVDGW